MTGFFVDLGNQTVLTTSSITELFEFSALN